jgi:hypothetical protein
MMLIAPSRTARVRDARSRTGVTAFLIREELETVGRPGAVMVCVADGRGERDIGCVRAGMRTFGRRYADDSPGSRKDSRTL